MIKNTEIINILDGFRTLAILPVMFYHYFSRWTSEKNNISFYPYDTKYDYFGLGYLGVQFFFIISGFVIFFTLERTVSISGFWKKRLFRLLPSMLVASVIIFLVFICFDKNKIFENSHHIKNFIPSITLVSPDIYNRVFSSENLQLAYLNGSFWSLWPEVQFYLFASVVFFLNRKKFLRNYFYITTIIIFLNWMLYNVSHGNSLHLALPSNLISFYQNWFLEGFNLFSYIIYFNIGMLFYLLYKKQRDKTQITMFEKVVFLITILLETYFSYQKGIVIPYILMIVLFLIFIYNPKKLSLLEHKIFMKTGASSYFTYLIHEHIGVLIINLCGTLFFPIGFILPIMLILLILILSHFYYVNIEIKISKWLKQKSGL